MAADSSVSSGTSVPPVPLINFGYSSQRGRLIPGTGGVEGTQFRS